jgi:hypothetical protein
MVGNRAAADAGEDEVKVKIGDKSQRGKKMDRVVRKQEEVRWSMPTGWRRYIHSVVVLNKN